VPECFRLVPIRIETKSFYYDIIIFFFIFKGKRIEIFNEVSYQILSEYHAFFFYQQNQTLKNHQFSCYNEKNMNFGDGTWGLKGILPREIWR